MNRAEKKALYTKQSTVKRDVTGNKSLIDVDLDVLWISGKGLYLVADFNGKKYYIQFSESP